MATIKIKQIKSKIGYPVDQKRTLQALGLHKISQVVEKEDTPVIRGMVRKVHHLPSGHSVACVCSTCPAPISTRSH